MKRKIYIRDGKRFKPVEDYTGYFYNEDGTFSKENQTNSIGRCCLQTNEYRLIIEICKPKYMNWYKAQEYWRHCFSGRGRGPKDYELVQIKQYLPQNLWLWSSTEYSSTLAYYLLTADGFLNDRNKLSNGYVLGFVELPIE
jgi:hypothetical protein